MGSMFYSDLLITFVCEMMKINYDHAQKCTPSLKGGRGGVLTKVILFCEHYNGLVLYFITDSYLLLYFFSVGFLYILVQKLTFLILTHNPK